MKLPRGRHVAAAILAQTAGVAENTRMIDFQRYPLLSRIGSPADLKQARRSRVACGRARVACLSDRIGRQRGRPFRRGSGRGRAYRRAALSVRHARRSPGVGCRSPMLSAQDPHRPPRPHPYDQAKGWPCAVSPTRRIRVRQFRRWTFVHLDIRRARHGDRRAAQWRRAQDRRHHRRRRPHRRHGLRGAAPRRRPRPGPARDPQRQPDVDQRERRRTAENARAADDQPHAQRDARGHQTPFAPRRIPVAFSQALGRTHQGHVRTLHLVRGIRFPLLRSDRRP